jgi:hypothetical protein
MWIHFEVSHLHMSRDTVRLRTDRVTSKVVCTKGRSRTNYLPVLLTQDFSFLARRRLSEGRSVHIST